MAENAVNNEENVNSQSSQLEEEGSTKVRGWLRASKHQKTDLLGFEEVYSFAREAKNKLWSSHRGPDWTKTEFCENFLPRWKQTRKQISRQVPWLVYELLFTVQLRDNLFQGR